MNQTNQQLMLLNHFLANQRNDDLILFFQSTAKVLLTLSPILISILVFYKTVVDNKTHIETTLHANIQNAKINLDNILYDFSKESLRKRKNLVVKPMIENYLIALNQACSLYLDREIKQKRFQSMYLTDIMNIFNGKIYSEIINDDEEGYHSLIAVHKKWTTKS